MKELHLTEGRNTGFREILDALSANGSPKPEFETDDERSYFISRLFIHVGFSMDDSKPIQKMGNNETVFETVLKQSEYQKILPVIDYLEDNEEISTETVKKLTGTSRSTSWRYIQRLCEANILEPIGYNNKRLYKRCFTATNKVDEIRGAYAPPFETAFILACAKVYIRGLFLLLWIYL